MTSKTTVFSGEKFSLCCGSVNEGHHFSIVYRNIRDPDFLHGNITQWIYVKEPDQYGTLFIEGEDPVKFFSGQLLKMPELFGKKAIWAGNFNWISFNPNPHTDNYMAEKVMIKPGSVVELQPVTYERYLVPFEGSIISTNHLGVVEELDNYTTLKILPSSKINLLSLKYATCGIFWKC
jgi:hypothetical protein